MDLQCDGSSGQSSHGEDGRRRRRRPIASGDDVQLVHSGQERKGVKFLAVGSSFGRVSDFMISIEDQASEDRTVGKEALA